jgi:hypothetical chaperone protein
MIYAIDFGTTNSLLGAVIDGKEYAPIPLDSDALDPTILRSVLFFPSQKQCFYGVKAVQEYSKHDGEGRLIRSIKKFLPARSFIGTYIENRPMNLEDIIGAFLAEMRRRANEHFNKDVTSVLLGRPARFAVDDGDDLYAQERLAKAARVAGFKHIEFCPEPVAAAWDFKSKLKEPQTVLVADFGGGTSDFTVVRIGGENFRRPEVLAIGGVSIAGDAFDGSLMRKRISKHFGADVQYQVPFGSNILTMPKYLMEKICSPPDISLLRKRDTMEFFRNMRTWSLGSGDRTKMDQLFCLIEDQIGFEVFEEIERTKRKLSDQNEELFNYRHADMRIEERITRYEFDEYAEELLQKILRAMDETVARAGIGHGQIDAVFSTGGTARVPALQRGIEARFGVDKTRQDNYFHSIVQGLIKRAAELEG